MKIEIQEEKFLKSKVESEKDKIFLFEDNNLKMGENNSLRNIPNAIGIRTRKGPSNKSVSFYSDNDFIENKKNIDEDILNVKKLSFGKTLVLSKNGYGTGSSKMKHNAPNTFEYLCESLKINFGFDNEKGTKWSRIPGYDDISNAIYINIGKDSIIKEKILQPVSNDLFRSIFLEKRLNNLFDLIKTENKIAFTKNVKFKENTCIIFVMPGQSEYLLVTTTKSYNLSEISNEDWSLFEGFDVKYIKSIKYDLSKYYQTHFNYICSISKDGKMTFKDGIFGDYNNKDKENENEKLEINNEKLEINKENEKLIDSLKKEIEYLKKPFYEKFLIRLKKIIKRKDIHSILEKEGMKGELTKLDNVLTETKNKKFFKLKTDKYTHFLMFEKGIFKNSINIVITFKQTL